MQITSLTADQVARMSPSDLSSTWNRMMGLEAGHHGGDLTPAQRATVIRNIELLEAAA
jgi:hypothetical protein